MTVLWQKIGEFSQQKPSELAVIGDDVSYSYLELYYRVLDVSQVLLAYSGDVVAFYADNSPDWLVVDLACQLANVTLLPIPMFFSDQQIAHALNKSGASRVIHCINDRLSAWVNTATTVTVDFNNVGLSYVMSSLKQYDIVALPSATAKITFTSGSTGQPKGVCLSMEQQLKVAQALLERTELSSTRHLSVIPFTTLLENIAGSYTPLFSGGCVIALSQTTLGFNGNSGVDMPTLLAAISLYQPNSMILLPELLLALVAAVDKGWQVPQSLEFIAVGGSHVSAGLLDKAYQSGLPVYQGYGLSECGSVLTLNSPKYLKTESVGKPLSHVELDIEQGEIVARGNAFLGYVGQEETWYQPKVYTGDLGRIDKHGYVYITGRKKNVLISSFGRNINPEWIEAELLSNGLIKQCVIFGDAKPYCVALIRVRDSATKDSDIQQFISNKNNILPEYAQVKAWFKLANDLRVDNGLITSNGRPIRPAIFAYYASQIEQLYQG